MTDNLVQDIYLFDCPPPLSPKFSDFRAMNLPYMEFYEEHFEPKTFELGLIDREIFAKKSPKT